MRHRDATGHGQQISIPLENVALATAGNLSFFTEAMINGTARERIGNSVYGQYGQDFTSSDGASFMVVALTGRHFRDLTELTGTTKAVAALAETLDADFTDEGERYRHRDALTGLFTEWFTAHTAEEITAALSATSVLVGAIPHLRRDGHRRQGDREPDVHAARASPGSGSTWHPGCPCRSTASTRRRWLPRRWATTPPRCLVEWLGLSCRRDRRAHRIGHRGNGFASRVSTLLRLLELQRAGAEDIWIGPGSGPDGKRAYGGQFVAQSLAAACRTVDADRLPTNMHLQFLRGGEAGDAVDYTVTRVFDGRTAAARRVDSHQDGRLLTTATVSFATDLPGPEHGQRASMPHDPDALPQTGPAGPRAVDAARRDRHQDRRRKIAAASSCAGCGGGQRFRSPTTHWCTPWSRHTSPTST